MAVLAKLDEQLAQASSLKGMFQLEVVRERGVVNFLSSTGLKDTEENRGMALTKFENNMFAYLEVMAEKPDLSQLDRFQHLKSIAKIMRMNIAFDKLYIMPGKNKTIKVDTNPAGKRELMERMPEVKRMPDATVVCKGDTFEYDELEKRVLKHVKTEKSPEPDKITLDVILYSYQRIYWADGRIEDVLVNKTKLLKARAKSPAQSDQSFWAQFPEDACKKVSTNRSYNLYHKWPDAVAALMLPGEDKEEKQQLREDDTEDITHETVHTQEQEQPAQETKVIKKDSFLED